jgi:hypothetical protein
VIAGLVLLLVHARLGRGGGGTTRTSDASPSRADRSADRSDDRSRPDDGHHGDGGLQPTARHRAA